jgi:hypothetical protein
MKIFQDEIVYPEVKVGMLGGRIEFQFDSSIIPASTCNVQA